MGKNNKIEGGLGSMGADWSVPRSFAGLRVGSSGRVFIPGETRRFDDARGKYEIAKGGHQVSRKESRNARKGR